MTHDGLREVAADIRHAHAPGSPTDRRRQPTHTWMTARIDGGRLDQVELHHLER
jgi:hypothetical protein